jgi:arabinofuranan 3-O-arabinosyltransferase
MGRMLRSGYGDQLYNRHFQRQVLMEVYPPADQDPNEKRSDVENLMEWMIEIDNLEARKTISSFAVPLAAANALGVASILVEGELEWEKLERIRFVGGPLYPPINCFTYYPLALFPPRVAYRINQGMNLIFALMAGVGIRQLSQGRIWWPIATTAIIAFPGFGGSISLGQNATLTFTILVLGWTLIARGSPRTGGGVWGLLAFKPVWGLNFFIVLVLMRRWRAWTSMIFVSGFLAVVTLPFVGIQGWQDWLQVGKEAAATYKADDTWIHLSRDLLSIPRRWLDFDPAQWYNRRDDALTTKLGWALILCVMLPSVGLALWRQRQIKAITGPIPAFLFLAAWLCCFHFMYYDLLLAALPVFLLFTDPRKFLEPIFFALVGVSREQMGEKRAEYYRPRFPLTYPLSGPPVPTAYQNIWVANRMFPSLSVFLLATGYVLPLFGFGLRDFPWDTICLMAFWLWCGWLWARTPHQSPARESTINEKSDPVESSGDAAQFVQFRAHVGGSQ